MTRETSLLLAAAQLLGPSVGGSDENFERIARQAVERALWLEELAKFAASEGRLPYIEPAAAQHGGAL